jgi:hypothetical protein
MENLSESDAKGDQNSNYKRVNVDLKEEFIMNNNRKVKIKQVKQNIINRLRSSIVFQIYFTYYSRALEK